MSIVEKKEKHLNVASISFVFKKIRFVCCKRGAVLTKICGNAKNKKILYASNKFTIFIRLTPF